MTKNIYCSMSDLLNVLKITKKELDLALEKGYKRYSKVKNGKLRWIEEPNEELKNIQKNLLKYLQANLACPPYLTAGFKGQNNIINAKMHTHKREVITLDISHCFPNTKAKYIKRFFKSCGAKDEILNILLKLTTYEDYLPTGAPTSTLLLAFAHKDIFDLIYKKMQKNNVDMTIYVDDITLSTHKHMSNSVIRYVNKVLKQHALWLKKSKTKRYGYRHAEVTGVHIAQNGKLSAPFCIGYSIVQKLRQKNIEDMELKELREIIAKIGYLQQFNNKTMQTTKIKAIKQLRKLEKTN